jgi:hypothetical protein
MAYLTKQDALNKLSPYGVKSLLEINRLIRKQGLPAHYISAHKVFFDEGEIDAWLAGRIFNQTHVHTAEIKAIKKRKRIRKAKSYEAQVLNETKTELRAVKKTEIKAVEA